jgi:hypothetical protein
MKMHYLLAGCVAATLVFSGCGSDSSSDSAIDREDVSSSSVKDESSSSKKVSSSSSKKQLPDGVREATLEDLSRNMQLDIDGHDVHMVAGSKQGLFSFWVVDTGEVVVTSDFKDGAIAIDDDNSATSIISKLDDDYFLAKMAKGMNLEFTVDSEGNLLYSVDKGEAKKVQAEQVPAGNSYIGNYDKMVGKKLTCKSGDTTDVYRFFAGRYVMESTAGKKTLLRVGGYADIHRGKLILMPEYYSDGVMALYMYVVSESFTLDEQECTSEEFKIAKVKEADLADNWYSYDKELKLDWNFVLKANGTFDLEGRSNEPEQKKAGRWSLYGDVLLLRSESCLDPKTCETFVMGNIEDFEKGKGFTYKHTSEEIPPMPTEWVVQKYED